MGLPKGGPEGQRPAGGRPPIACFRIDMAFRRRPFGAVQFSLGLGPFSCFSKRNSCERKLVPVPICACSPDGEVAARDFCESFHRNLLLRLPREPRSGGNTPRCLQAGPVRAVSTDSYRCVLTAIPF